MVTARVAHGIRAKGHRLAHALPYKKAPLPLAEVYGRATPHKEVTMSYRVVEYDSGPRGLPGMEALINEWAANGYRLDQVVRRSTYQWLLIFSSLS